MTYLREAAQMALDALDSDNPDIQLRAATHLRAALAQPAPEPVAWVDKVWIERPDLALSLDIGKLFSRVGFEYQVPLYTAPPQREWQGLTDEQILTLKKKAAESPINAIMDADDLLKEKNT